MARRTKWLIVTFIVIAVFSFLYLYLKNKSERSQITDGGLPCISDTSIRPAKVVSIVMDTSNFVYIKVELKTRDSIVQVFDMNAYYASRVIRKDELAKSGIKTGDPVKCTYITRLQGDCAPETFFFQLEKYHK
jgi:hypothetical protein